MQGGSARAQGPGGATADQKFPVAPAVMMVSI